MHGTHHAYYIEGSLSLFDAYKERLSPYYARQYERFGIEEARELTVVASLKNYQEVVFLIATGSITSEAQQALLKLFEEPQQGTQFVLIVPHGTLLPTLKSRMLELPAEQQIVMQNSLARKSLNGSKWETRGLFAGQSAVQFLKSSGKDRSDFITKLLKDDDNQKERVRDFINALEGELSKKISDTKTRQALEDISMVRDYVRDRSPSLKMLLEHLALALPTV